MKDFRCAAAMVHLTAKLPQNRARFPALSEDGEGRREVSVYPKREAA